MAACLLHDYWCKVANWKSVYSAGCYSWRHVYYRIASGKLRIERVFTRQVIILGGMSITGLLVESCELLLVNNGAVITCLGVEITN
jgi:hypothetical protein